MSNKFYEPLKGTVSALDAALTDGKVKVSEAFGVLMALGIAGYAVVLTEGGSFDAADEAEFADAIRLHYNETFTKYDLPGADSIWDFIITTVAAPGIATGVGFAINALPSLAAKIAAAPAASGSAPQ